MSGDVLLTVENLNAGYGSLQVLFDVSLDVRAGEVVALMGSNGAGKTTTMRALTGLLNHREFHTAIAAEIASANGFAVVLFDRASKVLAPLFRIDRAKGNAEKQQATRS